ncbi:RNA 2'-phosphotransferase [Eisenibacter elegans]|uniref:RNA 2'-phosphotransferase n=1 Tax=Eisenibacter elegans TaxID=997 RepID=UPI0003F95FB0|nr:RNA 2'-phosphotransferase [Eisenibacter elegans]
MRQKGFDIDLDLLKTVVATNAKKRFALSEDFTQIRANQEHSISVDLAYEVQSPPEILYHVTAQQHVAAIWREGIHKGQRHHVHLSPDPATAHNVGQRHGKPYVFVVLAQEMHAAGHLFYCTQNGVWLTKHVPTQFLREG